MQANSIIKHAYSSNHVDIKMTVAITHLASTSSFAWVPNHFEKATFAIYNVLLHSP